MIDAEATARHPSGPDAVTPTPVLTSADPASGRVVVAALTPAPDSDDPARSAVGAPGLLEPRLREQLALVVEWLKFAEAKHGFLIAFNGAALAALGAVAKELWAGSAAVPWWIAAYVGWFAVMVVLALAVSFTAVLPQLAVEWRFGMAAYGDANLVFFGDIAALGAEAYTAAVARAVEAPDAFRATRWEHDLAGQVVVNARIAVRKYRAFGIATALTLCGLLSPFAAAAWGAIALARGRAPAPR